MEIKCLREQSIVGETNVGHAGQKLGPANHTMSRIASHATSAKVKGSRRFTGESTTGLHGTEPQIIGKPLKKGIFHMQLLSINRMTIKAKITTSPSRSISHTNLVLNVKLGKPY